MKRTALRIETHAHECEQQQQIDEEHWVLDVPELKQKQVQQIQAVYSHLFMTIQQGILHKQRALQFLHVHILRVLYLLQRSKYVLEPSSMWCDSLKFGRMSFKGFNPDIEKVMKSMNTEQELVLAEEREKEISVSDTEMADRYSSLVGTIGQKFARKRKWKQESSDEEDIDDDQLELSREIEENVMATLAKLRKGEDIDEVITVVEKTETVHRKDRVSPKDKSIKQKKNVGKVSDNQSNRDSSAIVVISDNVPDIAGTSTAGDNDVIITQQSSKSPGSSKKVKAKSSVLEYYSKKKKDKGKPGFMKPKDD